MQIGNNSSRSSRTSEVGLVWRLVLNNASNTIEVPRYSTLYIKAKAACVVSVDAVDAVALDSDDIITINVGEGVTTDGKITVTVAFTGNVICSVADNK